MPPGVSDPARAVLPTRRGYASCWGAYEGGKFPFPLLANAELEVFKAYRAYDDFEERPLHGVFLIDGEGLVRWCDVSFEPFMDAKFVLGEARRLLGQSKHKRAKPANPDATSKVAGASN